MRKEFYLAVSERLLSIEGNPIKYVDLWNNNVEIQATLTNHNHEELVENVEVYNVTFVRSIEKRMVKVKVPVDVTIKSRNGQETEVVGPETP